MTELVNQYAEEHSQNRQQELRRIVIVGAPDDKRRGDPENRVHSHGDRSDTEPEIELRFRNATHHRRQAPKAGKPSSGGQRVIDAQRRGKPEIFVGGGLTGPRRPARDRATTARTDWANISQQRDTLPRVTRPLRIAPTAGIKGAHRPVWGHGIDAGRSLPPPCPASSNSTPGSSTRSPRAR